MDAQKFIDEVAAVIQDQYGLSSETTDLLISKYSLKGFLSTCGDKYPMTPEETADTMIKGLITYYNKKDR